MARRDWDNELNVGRVFQSYGEQLHFCIGGGMGNRRLRDAI